MGFAFEVQLPAVPTIGEGNGVPAPRPPGPEHVVSGGNGHIGVVLRSNPDGVASEHEEEQRRLPEGNGGLVDAGPALSHIAEKFDVAVALCRRQGGRPLFRRGRRSVDFGVQARRPLLRRLERGVELGVVGVEVLHPHLVRLHPLAERVVRGLIAWHCACLLSPLAGKDEKLYVCIHLLEMRAHCALFLCAPRHHVYQMSTQKVLRTLVLQGFGGLFIFQDVYQGPTSLTFLHQNGLFSVQFALLFNLFPLC